MVSEKCNKSLACVEQTLFLNEFRLFAVDQSGRCVFCGAGLKALISSLEIPTIELIDGQSIQACEERSDAIAKAKDNYYPYH